MSRVDVRDICFMEGMPKVCVPVVSSTDTEILEAMRNALDSKADVIEWRVDFYENMSNTEKVVKLLQDIRKVIGNTVLLFTFRTLQEGGNSAISTQDYIELCTYAAKSGYVDMIDIEVNLESHGLSVESLTNTLHQYDVKVVLSKHDFQKTPSDEEMKNYILYGNQLPVDIVKLAVMPQDTHDVLRLLSITNAYGKDTYKPLITMSMGPLGSITRACGEYFGSCMTFGSVGKASAPGQFSADKLQEVLQIFHDSIHG